MERSIKMTDENLNKILDECKDYAENCSIDIYEMMEYFDEIKSYSDWSIIYTGVFHDAIGEVVKIKRCIELIVSDEY